MSPWPAPYPAPHPSTSTTYPAPPQPFPLYAQGPDATTVASLKDERDRFKDLYEHKNKENQQLLQKMEQLKRQVCMSLCESSNHLSAVMLEPQN